MYSLRSVSFAALVAVLAFSAAAPLMAAPAGVPPVANYMPVGGQVAAPTGFLELCVRSPVDCQQSPRETYDRIVGEARTALIEKRQSQIRTAKVDGRRNASPIASPVPAPSLPVVASLSDNVHAAVYARIDLDEPTMTMVIALNDRVNQGIKAETDKVVYNTGDYWVAPGLEPGTRGDCEDFALEKRRLLIASGVPAAALSIAIVRTPAGEAHAVLVLSARQGDYILDNLHAEIKAWQLTDYSWISRQGPDGDLDWVSLAPANPQRPEQGAAK